MSQHNYGENIQQHLYEGDQSKLYSGIMNHHFNHDVKSEESKKQIGRIWKVFWILLVVTVIEVILGMFFSHHMPKALVAFFFLSLTLLKAGYIVSVFMHLGDEKKNFLITVLIPLVLFIWFIIAFLADGHFWLHMNTTTPFR
jgi:cytochrome c oxidase subunit IV